MHKPKVSVIMAVRNSEESVKGTIDAIIKQTFKNWEFVIVEDGSDDNTGDVVDEYAKNDNRIRVFHNKKRMERCFSRNKAISKAKGEYIAIHDGDDMSLPDRLTKEVKYLDENPSCYLVSARAYLEDENGRKIGESWGMGKNGDISGELEIRNRVVHSSIMFRNTGEYKYREKFLAHSEDYDLILQMTADGKEVHMLDDFLVIYSTKKNLVYNDYLIRQTYFAELARYLYRKKKYGGKDVYDEVDFSNVEQYVSEDVVLDLKMKKAFFEKDFIEARNILKKIMKKDKKLLWVCFYIDTFFNGTLYKIVRTLKRSILY